MEHFLFPYSRADSGLGIYKSWCSLCAVLGVFHVGCYCSQVCINEYVYSCYCCGYCNGYYGILVVVVVILVMFSFTVTPPARGWLALQI